MIADVHARYFGTELNDRSLTPGGKARLGPTRFEDWLSRKVGADCLICVKASLPGLIRQSIFLRRTLVKMGWMRGSSPRMTVVAYTAPLASTYSA